MRLSRIALAAGLLLVPATAHGVDMGYGGPPPYQPHAPQAGTYSVGSIEDTLRLKASVGVMYLEGNEFVYAGGYRVSRLIWRSAAPVLRGSISADLGPGFSVTVDGSVAGKGISRMEDYDWLKGDDTFDNWSHRSEHPDTSLDYFWTGAASLGYELANAGDAVVRLHGGFRYTDLKWNAYGGSYVYSSNGGFRDQAGTIADGTPAISYRQQLPELFLGVDGDQYYGNVRVGGLLRAGLVVGAVATDDHWLRDLVFTDTLYAMPTVELGLDAGVPLGRNVELTAGGTLRHIFEQRGDAQEYNTATGVTRNFTNSAAASLTQVDVSVGIRGSF